MEKFVYTDLDKIGVFDGQKSRLFESEYIVRYRTNSENSRKNNEWRVTGEGARFRNDYDPHMMTEERIYAYVNGVQWDGEKVLYCFTVNGSSGVYRKDVQSEKALEDHVLSSYDKEILTVRNAGNDLVTVTVKESDVTCHIGILDCVNSELRTLTDGDTRDMNAEFSMYDTNKLLFDSAGVGRDAQGNFTGKYAPAAVCALDMRTMEIEEVYSDKSSSCVKPKQDKDGTLYCIQKPNKEKRGGNPLVEILLIPFRIVQAIVMFISAFVNMFTGESMTSGGNNPTRGRKSDSRKLFVDGNLIEVEKELKRNKRFKDKEYGFIPMSWKLVKVKDGKAQTVKSGVCDYALSEDGGIYCTNGRHIFYIGKDGSCKKVTDTDMCLCVATESRVCVSREAAFGDFF